MEANAIITDLSNESEIATFEENLHELYTSWVLFTDCPSNAYKQDMTHTYQCLRKHLKKIDLFLKEQKL
jgi:hypothetical protein